MKHILFFVTLLLFVTLIGCGKSGIPGLVPAEGVVLFDGKPMDGVSIVFTPDAGSGSDRFATAVSKADGKFVLETANFPGAVPGKYSVTLSKTEITVKVSDEEAERLGKEGKSIPTETVYHLPWIYGDASKSGIKMEIPAKGDRAIRLELKPDNTPMPKKQTL